MGGVSEAEAAELERHLAGCDGCVARARREYQAATGPVWWAPQAPVKAVVARAPEVSAGRVSGWAAMFGFRPVAAFATAVIAIVAVGYFLWSASRRNADVVVASLMDGGGRVSLMQSGKIVLQGGNAPPAGLSAGVKDLLTKTVVQQPENVQMALAATRTDVVERGPSEEAAEDPILLSPFATAVRSTRPTFLWRPVKSAAGYTLYVVDRNQKLVWKGSAGKGTSLGIPARAPELARGEVYRWQVEATVRGEPRLSRWDSFAVLDEAGLEAVLAGEKLYSDSALLLGSLYEAHGLYAEAEAQFRRLVELNPSSALPGEMLASLKQLRKAS
jgi:hypothetical protein